MTIRTRTRFAVAVAAAILAGVVGTGSAFGIVYGEPDGGEHPHVGSVVVYLPGEGYFQACSGTLIEDGDNDLSSDVFLTAAHCMGFESLLPPGGQVLVTFSPSIDADATYYSMIEHPHPNFPGPANNPFDIGLMVLESDVNVGELGQLPSANLLSEMQNDHELKNQVFTAVGYGTIRESRTTAWQGILDNIDRNKADQQFLALTDAWLTLSMNQATGDGGTCVGDSGGPHFFEGTNVIASITITGDFYCKATDKTYRLDTEVVHDFLSQFVSLD